MFCFWMVCMLLYFRLVIRGHELNTNIIRAVCNRPYFQDNIYLYIAHSKCFRFKIPVHDIDPFGINVINYRPKVKCFVFGWSVCYFICRLVIRGHELNTNIIRAVCNCYTAYSAIPHRAANFKICGSEPEAGADIPPGS